MQWFIWSFSSGKWGVFLFGFIPLGTDGSFGLRTTFRLQFILSYVAWFLLGHGLPEVWARGVGQVHGQLSLPSFSHQRTSSEAMEELHRHR